MLTPLRKLKPLFSELTADAQLSLVLASRQHRRSVRAAKATTRAAAAKPAKAPRVAKAKAETGTTKTKTKRSETPSIKSLTPEAARALLAMLTKGS